MSKKIDAGKPGRRRTEYPHQYDLPYAANSPDECSLNARPSKIRSMRHGPGEFLSALWGRGCETQPRRERFITTGCVSQPVLVRPARNVPTVGVTPTELNERAGVQ